MLSVVAVALDYCLVILAFTVSETARRGDGQNHSGDDREAC